MCVEVRALVVMRAELPIRLVLTLVRERDAVQRPLGGMMWEELPMRPVLALERLSDVARRPCCERWGVGSALAQVLLIGMCQVE